MANGINDTNGFKAFWWVMGIISLLLSAGVVGAVATYAQVGRLDENVTLLREQVAREMDRNEERLRDLEDKFQQYILDSNRNGTTN